MSVPDFQTMMLPFLRSFSDGKEHKSQEIKSYLIDFFKLSDTDLKEQLPSGYQTKFENRFGWVRTYLKKALLIKMISRSIYQITDRGQELLKRNPDKINIKVLVQYPEVVQFISGHSETTTSHITDTPISEETPEELLAANYQNLRASLAQELLEQVKSCSPQFFEKLVVKLLVAMGYGGSIEDAGQATRLSKDGGIDGIIKEDKLGLDAILIQAKRWDSTVSRPDVQAFVGSLMGHKSVKGVFITTSQFSKDAIDFIRQLNQKVVLIDGQQLADYMIEYDVGVSKVNTYVVKTIDHDFFEEA